MVIKSHRIFILVFIGLAFHFSAQAQLRQALHALNQSDSLLFINIDTAKVLAKRAISLALEIENDTLAGKGYHNLGVAEAIRGNYSTSLQYFLQALAFFEKHKLLKRQSATVSNIAGVIMTQQRYREALGYLKQSLVLDSLLDDDGGIASAYQNMGIVYRKIDKPDSALYFLNRSLRKAIAISDKQIMASSKYNIANIYTQLGRYDEARKLVEEASAFFEQRQDLRGILAGIQYAANIEVKTGNFKQAITLATEGVNMARQQNLNELRASFLEILAKAYEGQQQHQQALHYHKLHKNLADSLYTLERARIVADLQYAYESEKKDKEIQVLHEEEAKQKLIIIVISVTAIAAIFLVVVIYLSKKIQSVRHTEREALLRADREKAQREKYQLETEKIVQEEENRRLQFELESSQRELATTALFIQQKNKLLEELQYDINKLEGGIQTQQVQEISRNLKQHMNFENDWNSVILHFEKVHPHFFDKLKSICPDITMNELRQAAYIRINLTNKDVANLLNVDTPSVKMSRYRLKKKLKLSPNDSLTSFIMSV